MTECNLFETAAVPGINTSAQYSTFLAKIGTHIVIRDRPETSGPLFRLNSFPRTQQHQVYTALFSRLNLYDTCRHPILEYVSGKPFCSSTR